MAFCLSTEYESLKHDVNTLFSNFYQKQSVRFNDFVTEWKNMNFGCIFAATYRNTTAAKMRITERLFRVASEFLSEETTFLYRVAAVYMFYAVYFRQLTETKVKIRMTPTMWKDLMEFFNIVIEHQHLDVAFIIQVLRKHKAFVFTAFPKYLLFGRHEFMMGIEGMHNLRHTYEADKYINELVTKNDLLDSLHRVQTDYEQVKMKVLQESKEDERENLAKVLYYSNSEFPRELLKMIESHKMKRRSSSKPDLDLDDIQRPVLSQLQTLNEEHKKYEGNGIQTEPQLRARTISKIKEKSWKTSASSSLHKSKNNSLEQLLDEQESVEPMEEIVYKKSAMLQPVSSSKRTTMSRGIRYRTNLKPSED